MRRHNKKEMTQLYERWLSSGIDKKVFALQEGISPSAFYYWTRKLEKAASGQLLGKGFRPILMESTVQPSTATAIVRYPTGVSIEWHGLPESVHLLKELI